MTPMTNYQSITTTEVTSNNNDGCSAETAIDDDCGVVVNDHPEDHLTPPFNDSTHRPSNLFVASFNLIATIVGGSVLSLPVVFERCGIFLTTMFMTVSAYLTYLSLIMFCLCSRRKPGGHSYGKVARGAFGWMGEKCVSFLMFSYIVLAIVAYMILIRDIFTPLVQQLINVDGDYVLLVGLLVLLPFTLQRSLHALRNICYVGFASSFILCIALCRGGLQNVMIATDERRGMGGRLFDDVQFFKVPTTRDLLSSFPIVTCAFECHYNIIAIQNALARPTRKRMERVIQYAIMACFFLYYMFGLGGYIYAGRETKGNILLNVPTARKEGADDDDLLGYYLFLLGRIGCGTTIALAIPINMLPCREALLEVSEICFGPDRFGTKNEQSQWEAESAQDSDTTEGGLNITLPEEADDTADFNSRQIIPPVSIPHNSMHSDCCVESNPLVHYGSTFIILFACYVGAVAVRGVADVWSFLGSSMATMITFIIPCGCFVVVEKAVKPMAEGGDRNDYLIRIAWLILPLSIVGAFVCTVSNTLGFEQQ